MLLISFFRILGYHADWLSCPFLLGPTWWHCVAFFFSAFDKLCLYRFAFFASSAHDAYACAFGRLPTLGRPISAALIYRDMSSFST
jgi:hypothetical protein